MDRRIARTRGALAQALIDLGPERGVDALGVGELAARAGVGRSTFYGHFADKADFLAASFVGLIEACEAGEAAADPHRAAVLPARALLSHVEQSRDFALSVQGSRAWPAMMEAGEARLRRIVEANLERRRPDLAAAERREAAVFVAGGFMALLRWWVQGGLRRGAAELEAAYEAMAARVLKEAQAGST
jgi:AcrR family transcriptional regulator